MLTLVYNRPDSSRLRLWTDRLTPACYVFYQNSICYSSLLLISALYKQRGACLSHPASSRVSDRPQTAQEIGRLHVQVAVHSEKLLSGQSGEQLAYCGLTTSVETQFRQLYGHGVQSLGKPELKGTYYRKFTFIFFLSKKKNPCFFIPLLFSQRLKQTNWIFHLM